MTDSLTKTSELTILQSDPWLAPFSQSLRHRVQAAQLMEAKLTSGKCDLMEFASGHEYFGLHFQNNQWILREWAPNATNITLIGSMNDWQEDDRYRLKRISEDGVWEIILPANALKHMDTYRLRLFWSGGRGDRIPAFARRVVKETGTIIFNAQVWQPRDDFQWQCNDFKPPANGLFIYEAHVGMAQEKGKVSTYKEFAQFIIPKIAEAGYNVIQLMAVPEHPYYGSFGYHVTNFFAAASQSGTPEDLKELIDTAHAAGIAVIMDIIHSHAAKNEVEGLSCFDGTRYQYFHEGERGDHIAWDSRCFDYGKTQILHFLLSNCRYWLDEFRFDGFRFDGITSMLYHHHGLGRAFTAYDQYFDESVDEEAIVYLTLANKLIHQVRPDAIAIAEDISGMPGLAYPIEKGGIGFDFRFAMGVPDLWIKLLKEVPDENWPIDHLYYELTNRRKEEKNIAYAESHDQAIVGDQTIIFRLIGSAMYDQMHADSNNLQVNRGIALHKLIRFITLTTAGNGYLNFMGNEFGHPDWIDFPREGNNWSFHHARRQWPLLYNPNLKYHFLGRFDKEMIVLAKQHRLLETPGPELFHEHNEDKVVAFKRSGLLFIFSFHPNRSHTNYLLATPPGKYRMIFDSDAEAFGGLGRLVPGQEHFTQRENGSNRHLLSLYLPTRTAVVLQPTT